MNYVKDRKVFPGFLKEYTLNLFSPEYCQVYGGLGRQKWNVEWEREICAGTPVKFMILTSLVSFYFIRRIT